jgi:plastocyanin
MTRRRIARLGPAVALAFALAIALFVGHAFAANAKASTASPSEQPVGPGAVTVTLTIHHSLFSPDHVRVRPGTTVHFVVDNQDPINHELIVGDDAVHRRHEAGTEPVHPPRPGEVSIPALQTADTTFDFPATGSMLYACHLPGHFRYGMSGVVEVVA